MSGHTPWAEIKRQTAARGGSIYRNGTTTEERFWARVDRSGGPDACWVWMGDHNDDGYGRVHIPKGKPVPAHRFSYELVNGPIPDGLRVLHHCDNPPCVNPVHLFVGTQADNGRDMVAKGRWRDKFGGPRDHCHRGHPFNEANTRINRKGNRVCRACDLLHQHAYLARVSGSEAYRAKRREYMRELRRSRHAA